MCRFSVKTDHLKPGGGSNELDGGRWSWVELGGAGGSWVEVGTQFRNTRSLTISDVPFTQITIQEDHNIHTYSLFCLVVLAEQNSRMPLLPVTYRNQVFFYFHL